MNTTVKKLIDIDPGDIFYFEPDTCDNPELIGKDFILTGIDQIFICDDNDRNSILVNGGFEIFITETNEDQELLVIGHYADLIKQQELKIK